MKIWTVQDRYDNEIYLTEERWQHILESRPEMEPFIEQFLETIRSGRRRQEELIPNEYRYYRKFNELLPENNHIIVKLVFKTRINENGNYVHNNFVVTGWARYIISKR